MHTTLLTLALALGLLVPAAPRSAQERAGQAPGGQAEAMRQRQELEEELRELFERVETNLRAIDAALGSAAAGETPLDVPPESGIGQLLQRARQRGRDIDQQVNRILEIARQLEQKKSKGRNQPRPNGQQQSGDQPSPLDRARNEPREAEPKPKEGAPEPQPGDSEKPQSNQGADPNARNRPGQRLPPDAPPGSPSRAVAGGEAWGDLPERAREVFRTQGGADMPVEYRDWIDAYYRRLNQTRRP